MSFSYEKSGANKSYYKLSKFAVFYDFIETIKMSNLLNRIFIRFELCYFLYRW